MGGNTLGTPAPNNPQYDFHAMRVQQNSLINQTQTLNPQDFQGKPQKPWSNKAEKAQMSKDEIQAWKQQKKEWKQSMTPEQKAQWKAHKKEFKGETPKWVQKLSHEDQSEWMRIKQTASKEERQAWKREHKAAFTAEDHKATWDQRRDQRQQNIIDYKAQKQEINAQIKELKQQKFDLKQQHKMLDQKVT